MEKVSGAAADKKSVTEEKASLFLSLGAETFSFLHTIKEQQLKFEVAYTSVEEVSALVSVLDLGLLAHFPFCSHINCPHLFIAGVGRPGAMSSLGVQVTPGFALRFTIVHYCTRSSPSPHQYSTPRPSKLVLRSTTLSDCTLLHFSLQPGQLRRKDARRDPGV